MQEVGNELLLAIPQAQLQIYSKFILLLFEMSPRDKTIPMEALSTVNAPNGSKSNIISLVNSQLVFEIVQQTLDVKLANIRNNQVILSFHVNTYSTLMNVQSLLRMKLCELGFEKRFSFIKKLGQGASAQVYLIQRLTDSKLFAAKVISLKTSNEKLYETFLNQTRLLRCLNHKHIVRLQSVYYSKKHLYQVLEYLEGGTLLQELMNNTIKSKKDRWRVVYHITLAVQYLRQKMIVHRDIKLQNIMVRLNPDGTKDYVLTDFGLSSWIGQKKLLYQRCGTPGYIAPQILLMPKGVLVLTHKLDVFSLGVIYHLILMGKNLFKFQGCVKKLLLENKNVKVDFNNPIYDDLSYSEYKMLESSLATDPNLRITAKQLLQKYILSQSIVQSIINQKQNKFKQQKSNKIRASRLSEDKKIQIKDIKQKFSRKSLFQSLTKINQQKNSVSKNSKTVKEEKGFIKSIFDKLSFSQKKSQYKKSNSARRLQMSQFNIQN